MSESTAENRLVAAGFNPVNTGRNYLYCCIIASMGTGYPVDFFAGLPLREAAKLRDSIKERMDREMEIDRRYTRMSQRLSADAQRAAADAKTSDVERVLAKISTEDQKLGGQRPETVQALRASIEPIAASAGTVIAGLLCLLLSDLKSNSSLGPVAATLLGSVSATLVRTAGRPSSRSAAAWSSSCSR